MFRIGYLGPKGTFSQEALEEYVGNKIHTALDFGTISDMLHAVEAGSIDEAVVPIENSIEGAVNATMDMLAFDVDLKIKAELLIPVNQHLLVKKGTQIENIRYIISSPAFWTVQKFHRYTFSKGCFKVFIQYSRGCK